jgi:hypothetical protein
VNVDVDRVVDQLPDVAQPPVADDVSVEIKARRA